MSSNVADFKEQSLVKYRPTCSLRWKVRFDGKYDKVRPFKSLTVAKKSTGGRNNHGRITCRGMGGGVKNKYRMVSFKRKVMSGGIVLTREYDPIRNASISLIKYENGTHEYILTPEGLKRGSIVSCSDSAPISVGNCMRMRNIPVGTSVHNVEMRSGSGGVLARSAGSFGTIIAHEVGKVHVKVPSGYVHILDDSCFATIGKVGNALYKNQKLGNAGTARRLGVRPVTRGVAMNPADHPMGGGEGKTSGGRQPCSPWGQLSKGFKTRSKKKTNKFRYKG